MIFVGQFSLPWYFLPEFNLFLILVLSIAQRAYTTTEKPNTGESRLITMQLAIVIWMKSIHVTAPNAFALEKYQMCHHGRIDVYTRVGWIWRLASVSIECCFCFQFLDNFILVSDFYDNRFWVSLALVCDLVLNSTFCFSIFIWDCFVLVLFVCFFLLSCRVNGHICIKNGFNDASLIALEYQCIVSLLFFHWLDS